MEGLFRNGKKQSNVRRFPGIKGRRPDQKASRKEVADENLKRWRAMSPDQQLADLDRRLGKKTGAKKQRARIVAQRSKSDRKGT